VASDKACTAGNDDILHNYSFDEDFLFRNSFNVLIK
jgi:hypothetical protein